MPLRTERQSFPPLVAEPAGKLIIEVMVRWQSDINQGQCLGRMNIQEASLRSWINILDVLHLNIIHAESSKVTSLLQLALFDWM